MSKHWTHSTLTLFLAFFVLFVVVFSLGVLVGKGLGGFKPETKNYADDSGIKYEWDIKKPDNQAQENRLNIGDSEPSLVMTEEIASDNPELKIYTPRVDAANIRGGPGREHTWVTSVKRGQEVYALGDKEGKWIKVKTPDGKKGWVSSRILDEVVRDTISVKVASDREPVIEEIQTPETSYSEQPSADRAKMDENKPVATQPYPEKKLEPIEAASIDNQAIQPIKLPPTDNSGRYTVQIGAFQDQNEANKYAKTIRLKGYPVFIKTMKGSAGKNWYRVRVGTFDDIDKAREYGEGLKTLEPEVTLVFITINE